MHIILLQDVDKVGKAHEIVKVKDGYGRNYLIPQGLAIVANASNKKVAEERARQAERRRAKIMAQLADVAKLFEGKTLKIGAKTGQTDKIFGSITNIQLSQSIKEQLGADVDRKQIEVPEDIRTLGTYTAKVALHKELVLDVPFEVVEE
jgi:large subunit ribosomal protein L9